MNLEKNGESGLKTVRSFLGKMGTRQWVILLLLGLLLTVIALPVSDKKGEKSSGKGQSTGIFTDTASDDAEVQRTALEEKLRGRDLQPLFITGHTGWTDNMDFAFAQRNELCSPFRKKAHDPNAPYDAYDESDDTEERANSRYLAGVGR